MRKYLPFSRRQPSLDRFAVNRGGWSGSDRFNGKSLRRTSAASLNTRSIQVVRGAYNIDLNKVDASFTKLHRACLLNDEAQVKKHIHKVDNNSHDSSKRYPLHLATVNGNFSIIKQLIENGANPNVQDNEGNTPLIKSIECGHEHLVKYFLSNGADPNVSDMDNNTALHWAIMTESIIAIDALISSKKCDLALRNNKDEICLHLAVRSPLINTFTFEAMIRGGADLNAKDQLGLTVLDIAQACNNKVALNALNRCNQTTTNEKVVVQARPETDRQVIANQTNETSDTNQTSDMTKVQRMCDDYKSKLMTKNRENLEYEKKLIQVNAQVERLIFDISCLEEQVNNLKSDCTRLITENSKLKSENSDLQEQLSSLKQNECLGEVNKNRLDQILPTSRDNDELQFEGHKEFLATKAFLQERINKLKNGL